MSGDLSIEISPGSDFDGPRARKGSFQRFVRDERATVAQKIYLYGKNDFEIFKNLAKYRSKKNFVGSSK